MTRIFATLIVLFIASLPARAAVEIQEVTSPGGIKAWLVTEPSIPILTLEIGFKGGASLDPDGQEGATYFMTGLLEEGTGDLDAAGFARATESLAAQFGFDASRSSVSISASVLKSNADQALELLRRAIVEPAFNDAAVERVRGQINSILDAEQSNPDEIASQKFNELAFAGHPYARSRKGTLDSIATITADQLRAVHRATMAKDRLFVGVVGDVTAEELGPILDRLLGELPETGAQMPEKIDFGATGGVTVVDFDTPQSAALWGHAGIERDDPDFFAAHIMNHILGGGSFTSRLTQEVREKRGLTYGIYSYVAPMDYSNMMGGQVSSSNDSIGEAMDLIRAEWRKMAEGGVTEAELEAAKKYITGSYPLRFDGNSAIANILLGMQRQELPRDYPVTRNDRMNAVTREDIARVAKRLLRADDIRFVVVGRPEGVTSTD